MTSLTPTAEHSAELLQNLSLDSQTKTSEIPEPTKTAVYQYEPVDSNGQAPSFNRSTTPLLHSDALDPSVCYVPNAYHPYYFGGYANGLEWNDYTGYVNPDAVDMTNGIYGENASLMYPQGYAYATYPYSPATSPAPQSVGNDGQLYNPQQYHYPSYFPLSANTGPFTSSAAPPSHGDFSTDEQIIPANSTAATAGASKNSIVNDNSGPVPVKPLNQGAHNASAIVYGNGATGVAYAAGYHDPRFSYEGLSNPVSWQEGSKFSGGQRPVSGNGVTGSYSKANNVSSSRNQNYQSNSQYMGQQHQPASMARFGTSQGYYNRMNPNKIYSQYGSEVRSGMGYGFNGYDSRTNGRWVTSENKYRSRGKGNNYIYGSENIDGLNELNRGPRSKGVDVNGQTVITNGTEDREGDKTCVAPDRDQYNRDDFLEEYSDAKFFVIKSYSEDDLHNSIKHNVWASTPNGNKKLDAAYHDAQQKPGSCPVFLFFSVNASGQFVGLAEMTGAVDFNKNEEYWQQDKWTGSFPLTWHILKDVPNNLLKHITLENNENKPVTNSRDTQEVKLEQGLKILKIFKQYCSKTCILDDFSFYEVRQKTIQEKKAKQQQQQKQLQKQVWEGKGGDDKKECSSTVEIGEDLKVAEAADSSSGIKQAGEGVKGC